MPSAHIAGRNTVCRKAFGPRRGLIMRAAFGRADGLRRPRTAPVRVPPDPREPDDGRGPPPRPRGDIRDRTHRGGPRRAVAARRALFRPARARPRRDRGVQTESDLRVRGRHRDFASGVATARGWATLLPVVRDPGRVSPQLRGRGLIPVPLRVVRGDPRPHGARPRDERWRAPPHPVHARFDPRVPVGVPGIRRGHGGDPRSIRASRGAHGEDREALLERAGFGAASPRERAARPDRGRLPRVLSASLDRRRGPLPPVGRGLWTHARGPDHRARPGPRPPRRFDGSNVATERAAERDSPRAGEVPRAPPGASGGPGKPTLNKVNSREPGASTFVAYAPSSPDGSPSRSRTWSGSVTLYVRPRQRGTVGSRVGTRPN